MLHEYLAGDRADQGQNFITGSNTNGYMIKSVWLRHVGYANNTALTCWQMDSGVSMTVRVTDPTLAATSGFALDTETYTTTDSEGWSVCPSPRVSRISADGKAAADSPPCAATWWATICRRRPGCMPIRAASYLTNINYLVQELRECQDALGAQEIAAGRVYGYLSGFPSSYFDTLETNPTSAQVPFYTIHKILAGLVDACRYTTNNLALDIAIIAILAGSAGENSFHSHPIGNMLKTIDFIGVFELHGSKKRHIP